MNCFRGEERLGVSKQSTLAIRKSGKQNGSVHGSQRPLERERSNQLVDGSVWPRERRSRVTRTASHLGQENRPVRHKVPRAQRVQPTKIYEMGSRFVPQSCSDTTLVVRRSRRLHMRTNLSTSATGANVDMATAGNIWKVSEGDVKTPKKMKIVSGTSAKWTRPLKVPNNTPTDETEKGCEASNQTMDVIAYISELSFHEDNDITMRTEDSFDERTQSSDPLMMSTYSIDMLKYYQEHEIKSYSPDPSHMPSVEPSHRRILVHWLIDVQNHLELEEETLHLTVALIDAVLRKRSISLNDLQLLGVTCLLLACKYEEIYIPEIQTLCSLCANAYDKPRVLSMERCILRVLQFNLLYPTAVGFLQFYLVMNDLHTNQKLLYTCQYLLDLSLTVSSLQRIPPSLRAAAALHLALASARDERHSELDRSCREPAASNDAGSNGKIWTRKHVLTTGYIEIELTEARTLLLARVKQETKNPKAAYNKYHCEFYHFASKSLETLSWSPKPTIS